MTRICTVALSLLLFTAGLTRAAEVIVLHLDEDRGTKAYDASGNGNHGTLGFDATWTNAPFGGGVTMDGQGDHLAVADSPTLDAITGGITVDGWAKVTSMPSVNANNNYRMLFSKGGRGGGVWDVVLEENLDTQWSVRTASGSEYRFRHNSTGTTGSIWALNEWTYFAYTYDATSGEMAIYRNGNRFATTKAGGTMKTNDAAFYLSHPNNTDLATVGGEGAFPGIFDEVTVHDRALSQSEIQARYTSGSPLGAALVQPQADVLLLHLDENGGVVASDSTTPAYNGSLNAGASWTTGQYGRPCASTRPRAAASPCPCPPAHSPPTP